MSFRFNTLLEIVPEIGHGPIAYQAPPKQHIRELFLHSDGAKGNKEHSLDKMRVQGAYV